MMDKKCLEAEQIQLFIDNELSSAEAIHVNDHLAVCDKCRSAIENARAFDQKLQKQFESAFSAEEITRNVMNRVRELKAPDAVPVRIGTYFNLRWLSAFALALVVVLAVFNISTPTQFSSSASISFVAADSNSTIDGVRAGTGYQFPLEPLQAIKPLSGKFLFEQKLATDTTVFKVTGNVGVQLREANLIAFSGTHGDFVIDHVSGNSQVTFTLNNGPVITLTPEQKLEFSIATRSASIGEPPAESVTTVAADVAHMEKGDQEVATATIQVVGSDSVQIIEETVPALTELEASDQPNTDAVGTEASELVEDRPNPFVDAPLGIGGAP